MQRPPIDSGYSMLTYTYDRLRLARYAGGELSPPQRRFAADSAAWLQQLISAFCLSACIAPLALAQSTVDLSPPSTTSSIVPSDSAASAGLPNRLAQSGTGKNGAASPFSAPKMRGMSGREEGGRSQELCFQLGIGWLRVPQTSLNSANLLTTASAGKQSTGEQPASDAQRNPGALRLKLSKIASGDCSAAMAGGASAGIPAADEISFDLSESGNATTSSAGTLGTGLTGAMSGNTGLKPVGSALSGQGELDRNPGIDALRSLTARPGARASEKAVDELLEHRYVSADNLSRMMRDAPDLRTKLQLQRVIDLQQEKKKHHTSAHSRSKHHNRDSEKGQKNITQSRDKLSGFGVP
jgi:hypothetical protein